MNNLNDELRRLQRAVEQAEPVEGDFDLPACEICDGAGYVLVPVDEPAADISQLDNHYRRMFCPVCDRGEQLKQRAYRLRYEKTELPMLYREASLDDIQKLGSPFTGGATGKVLAYLAAREFATAADHRVSWHGICRRVQDTYETINATYPAWVDEDLQDDDDVRDGLVLWGSLGTGKTHIAAAVVNHLTRRGEYAMYMRMSRILETLTDTWSSNEVTGEVLDTYCNVPVLFIDDMNTEHRTGGLLPHQREYAAAIMRYRTNHRLPTLITTNWSPDQFRGMWGSWCADVVLTYHWVEVQGRKVRYAKPKEREL